jgi:transcriptional regulator with XRE-family HTH domain
MLDDQKLTIELGKRIQRYRRMQVPLMSQERLASLLGLTRTSVTNIERGKQKMTLDTVYKLCEAFDVPLNEFLPPLSDVLADLEQSVVVGGQAYDLPAKTANAVKRLLPGNDKKSDKAPQRKSSKDVEN